MVRGYYQQIERALRSAGFEFRRSAKGDHEIWHSAGLNKSVTVDRGCLSRQRIVAEFGSPPP